MLLGYVKTLSSDNVDNQVQNRQTQEYVCWYKVMTALEVSWNKYVIIDNEFCCVSEIMSFVRWMLYTNVAHIKVRHSEPRLAKTVDKTRGRKFTGLPGWWVGHKEEAPVYQVFIIQLILNNFNLNYATWISFNCFASKELYVPPLVWSKNCWHSMRFRFFHVLFHLC